MLRSRRVVSVGSLRALCSPRLWPQVDCRTLALLRSASPLCVSVGPIRIDRSSERQRPGGALVRVLVGHDVGSFRPSLSRSPSMCGMVAGPGRGHAGWWRLQVAWCPIGGATHPRRFEGLIHQVVGHLVEPFHVVSEDQNHHATDQVDAAEPDRDVASPEPGWHFQDSSLLARQPPVSPPLHQRNGICVTHRYPDSRCKSTSDLPQCGGTSPSAGPICWTVFHRAVRSHAYSFEIHHKSFLRNIRNENAWSSDCWGPRQRHYCSQAGLRDPVSDAGSFASSFSSLNAFSAVLSDGYYQRLD